jgi:hypothetical protein
MVEDLTQLYPQIILTYLMQQIKLALNIQVIYDKKKLYFRLKTRDSGSSLHH